MNTLHFTQNSNTTGCDHRPDPNTVAAHLPINKNDPSVALSRAKILLKEILSSGLIRRQAIYRKRDEQRQYYLLLKCEWKELQYSRDEMFKKCEKCGEWLFRTLSGTHEQYEELKRACDGIVAKLEHQQKELKEGDGGINIPGCFARPGYRGMRGIN